MIRAQSLRYQRTKSALLLIAAMIVISPISTRANELFSESVFVPKVVNTTPEPITTVSGWNNLNILMWGTGALPAQDPTDTNTDAFAVNGTSTITVNSAFTPLATDEGTFVGPGPISIGGLQRVTFAGTTPINQANIPDQGLANPTDQVQFGLTGPANNSVMNFLEQHWGGTFQRTWPVGALAAPTSPETDNYLRAVPIVNVTPHPAPPAAPPSGQSFEYIVDFIQFTQPSASASVGGLADGGANTITGSEWVEFPFVPGQQPTFTYSGWADAADAIHFTEHFVQISPTMIPLDDLNYADDPPPILDPLPGAPTEPTFASQADPDDIVVATPEPGVMAIMLGAAMAIGRRRK
jgi:hypothetical protein